MYCAVPVFQHPDPDLACDQLSTNHRLPETADVAKFGTMVVAGSSTDYIQVLIPDTVGPTVDADSPVVLQHVVGLSLGPAVDLSSSLPPTNLALALCDNSVLPTLTRRRRAYWAEINPILRKWQSINDARCPACDRLIRINMSRHLRLSHTFCQCFWRCPVPSCPMWFTSELDGNDHLEWIHSFTEGRGYSFYDCLRQYGLEWFGRRSFFDQRHTTGQALWMDLALARKYGLCPHIAWLCPHKQPHLRNSPEVLPRGRPGAYSFIYRLPKASYGHDWCILDVWPDAPGHWRQPSGVFTHIASEPSCGCFGGGVVISAHLVFCYTSTSSRRQAGQVADP